MDETFSPPVSGSAAGMESLEKVWNLFFQFPDLEKVWKFVKSFGNFKKRFGTFCLLPEKNLEDRKCASRSSARKLLPCVLSKAVRGLYRLFTFVPIHRTNCVGQAQSCLPAASNKKGKLGIVRLPRKDRSQVRPWILISG